MRHRELDRRCLIRHDISVLATCRRGVNGHEVKSTLCVTGDHGAAEDQRFGVLLVLDHAEVGGLVGVAEFEGLEFGDVEEAFEADAETEGAVNCLAFGVSKGAGGGGGEEEGGSCEGGDDKHGCGAVDWSICMKSGCSCAVDVSKGSAVL